jgi:hypothetical protein
MLLKIQKMKERMSGGKKTERTQLEFGCSLHFALPYKENKKGNKGSFPHPQE